MVAHVYMFARWLIAGGALCCTLLVAVPGAAQGTAPPAALVVSADGTLVIDARSGLAWDRCVLGMHWNGSTCAGRAQGLTFVQAKALAEQRWKSEGVRWRLPRVAELRRLVDRNANPPAVDAALFPNAPSDWHWTGTHSVNAAAVNPYAYDNVTRGGQGRDQLKTHQGWAVDMGSGKGRGDVGRATLLPVRLVRPAPKP